MTKTSAFIIAAICFWTLPGVGQVYSGGDPPGFTIGPFTHVDSALPAPTGLLWKGDLRACTSGPDYLLIAGYRYEGIWAVGGPYVMDNQVYEVPILTMWELSLDSMFDEDDEITALAATPERDAVYVSFHPIFPTVSCLPIVRVAFDGSWTVAVGCDEIGAFAAGKNRVRNLATASDGTLYAIVRYQDAGYDAVVRIDPAGPPGKRTEMIISGEDFLPATDESDGVAQLLQIAPIDQGGLVVLGQLGIAEEGFVDPAWVLVRRDADGTMTELTQRERVGDMAAIDSERHLPALSCLEGMLFDQADRLLVCGGNGKVFLMDPDEPGRSSLVISSQVVMNTLSAFQGAPVYSPPGGAQGSGGCLGDISWAGRRAYGTWMGTFMVFNWDEQLLDLDRDLAMGHEEALRNTHRFIADSDGGGTGDGLEATDYTDPTLASDDRSDHSPDMRWASSGLWFGSLAGNSTSSRHKIGRFGLAAPDGSLLLMQDSTGSELLRFTGWDEPLVPTGQTGSGSSPMAMGSDGSVYRHDLGVGIVRSRPDGSDEIVVKEDEYSALTGSDTLTVSGLAVHPDGRVLVGTMDGHLVAAAGPGKAQVLYDAFEDYAAAGFWDEETECFGGLKCVLSVGPVTWEPVHGLLLFWLKTDFVGSASYGFMSDLVMVRPDGHMRIVADHWAFAEDMALLGGLDPLDMEPDMKGGLWVLGAGGGGRRLLHLDGRTLAPVTGITHTTPLAPPLTTAGGLRFLDAWDLMVTPQGRLFAADAYFSNMSGLVPAGLVELLPTPDGIRAGDLLLVQPDEAALARLLPDGGGELLYQGDPLVRPTAVAAAHGKVVVGDSGRGEVLVSTLDAQGSLGPWTTLAALASPSGMDIDDEGRILVVDREAKRLLRIDPTGTVDVLADGGALGHPLDVVATASGALAVTDTATGRLLRLSPQGQVTTLAELTTPGAVALVPGKHYLVASTAGDVWPRTVASDGAVGATGTLDTSWDLGGGEEVGGLAADPDGTVYLAMVKEWSWDWKDPFPTLRVFRMTPAGYVQSLVRGGLRLGPGGADLCRVRGLEEPLPAEPGDKPLAPIAGDANEDSGPQGSCGSGPGGSMAGMVFLCLLVGLLGLLRQRLWPRAFLAALAGLLLVTMACSPGTGGGPDGGGDVWDPGVVSKECQGKELCQPGSAPVCVDGPLAAKRCLPDEQGCWVYGAVQSCPLEAPCEDGVCGGLWCRPGCGAFRNCGDDGCGGSCGTCEEPDVCCDGMCGACQADCTGRECGWDGATGSCGNCPEAELCVAGTCQESGRASCGEFLNDCDALCEAWDTVCQDQCTAWLSPEGKVDFFDFEGCTLLHCAACFEPGGDQGCLTACVFTSCLEEYATCFNRYGTATCAETWNCANACSPSDQPCIDACTAQATREAMMVLVKLVVCLEATCPPDAPDAEREACEESALLGECSLEADGCLAPCEPVCPGWATCGPDQCTGLCGICSAGMLCNGFECIQQ